MRAALISPSKQTMQSRLERDVLLGLVAPFRLPKDPRDSVGELEVVVDPPETPAEEKAPRMVPLVEEENPEAESWSAALSRRPRPSTSLSTGHPLAEEEEDEDEDEVSSAEFLRSLVDPKAR